MGDNAGMPSPLLLPVVTCAVVLLVSGVAKLQSPSSVEAAFTSMHVPKALDTALVRRAVPWLEVALGVWLLLATGPALVVVAVLTLVLFVAYLALVVVAVRGPEPADCGCFGAIGDSRVTRVTVWRNALLVLAALLAVAAGLRRVGLLPALLEEPSTWGWLATAALASGVAVLVAHRSGQAGEAPQPQVDASGEYVRSPIPAAAVLTEEKDLVLLSTASQRAAHLLVFLSPAAAPASGSGRSSRGGTRSSPGRGPSRCRRAAEVVETGLPFLKGYAWFDPHGLARKEFGAGNPSAVLLGADGYLAGGPVHGEDAVREFVAGISEQLSEAREAAEIDRDRCPGAGAGVRARVAWRPAVRRLVRGRARDRGHRRRVSSQASSPPSSSLRSFAAG